MTARVSPTERIRADIDELFGTEGDLGETLEQVARLGARLLLQAALEAEVTEFLGRNRYERRALATAAKAGSRNGFAPLTVKSTAGPITLERPKLRGTDMAFASRLLGAGVTKTNALESLVIAGFVRGLSVRDVEATLAEALGPDATVSRSTVSRICEAIKDEFDAFKIRDLSEIELEYLFLDGSHFRMHAGTKAEPVLVAWGIDVTGKPHLLHLEPGATESTDAWAGFLRGMLKRGLRPPLLVISDGGPGLIAAVEIVLSASLRQRCLIHAFSAKWSKLYPAAVECLNDGFCHLTTYLRFPKEHWKRIRHSNFIERTFGETRRRVKVIGRLPGERSCLSLVWAVLDRAGKGWRGVDMSPRAVRLLQDLRRELFGPPARADREEVIDEAVTPAA